MSKKKAQPMRSILIVFCLSLRFSLFAQSEFGQIKGVVTNAQSEESIPFVNLRLLQQAEAVNGTVSNLDGEFQFKNVPVGTYQLEITFVGYETKMLKKVKVRANKPTTLNIKLKEQELYLDIRFGDRLMPPINLLPIALTSVPSKT